MGIGDMFYGSREVIKVLVQSPQDRKEKREKRSSSEPPAPAHIDYVALQKQLLEAQQEEQKAKKEEKTDAEIAARKRIQQIVLSLKRDNPARRGFDNFSAQLRMDGMFGIGGSADPTAREIVAAEEKKSNALMLGPRPLPYPEEVKNVTHVSYEELIKKAHSHLVVLSMQDPAELYDQEGVRHTYNKIPIPASEAEVKRLFPEANIEFIRLGLLDHSVRVANTLPLRNLSFAELSNVLARVHALRMGGYLAYIHCWGGQERSVVATVAYLIDYNNKCLTQAVESVQEKRPAARGLEEYKGTEPQENSMRGFMGCYYIYKLSSAITRAGKNAELVRSFLSLSVGKAIDNLKYFCLMDWDCTISEDRTEVMRSFANIMTFLRPIVDNDKWNSILEGILKFAGDNKVAPEVIAALKNFGDHQAKQKQLEEMNQQKHIALVNHCMRNAGGLEIADEAIQKLQADTLAEQIKATVSSVETMHKLEIEAKTIFDEKTYTVIVHKLDGKIKSLTEIVAKLRNYQAELAKKLLGDDKKSTVVREEGASPVSAPPQPDTTPEPREAIAVVVGGGAT